MDSFPEKIRRIDGKFKLLENSRHIDANDCNLVAPKLEISSNWRKIVYRIPPLGTKDLPSIWHNSWLFAKEFLYSFQEQSVEKS